ncbi:MAG: ATP-binding protein [Actinobacteria bacterium]|nr:ATP-binding protein [Actinomycetota bacterium]
MAEVVQIEVPARPEYLALVRLLVASATATAPLFADERLDDLRLVISEACTNAMEAQQRASADGRPEQPIRVRCVVDPEKVELEIRDHGGGFDPSVLRQHPPVSDPARLDHERGLGITLMRMLADELEFDPVPGGTVVRLTILALPPAGAA